MVTWAAIGARTTESQIHRQMASGLSMPVGFKNSTDGALQNAINAMLSARHAHAFLGINADGISSVVRTTGNLDGTSSCAAAPREPTIIPRTSRPRRPPWGKKASREA